MDVQGMSMSFKKWNRIPIREAALIVTGGGLAAWYGPQLGPLAIIYVVLVDRFRGRAQALIGAFAFTLVVLVSALVRPSVAHPHADLVQLLAVVCVMWICAISVSCARADATTHPEREDAVHDRDKVWDAVLKIFPGWMWVSRADGTPVSLSQGAYEYAGLAAETLLADGFDCIHPDDRQRRRDFWKTLLKTEEPGELEMRVRGADGSYRWFASRSYPIRDVNGKLERWASINWDIDERKRAEQQISQVTQLNLLGERFPGFLWKARPDGRVIYINRYCEDYLGMTAEKAAADWERLIHPGDRMRS